MGRDLRSNMIVLVCVPRAGQGYVFTRGLWRGVGRDLRSDMIVLVCVPRAGQG